MRYERFVRAFAQNPTREWAAALLPALDTSEELTLALELLATPPRPEEFSEAITRLAQDEQSQSLVAQSILNVLRQPDRTKVSAAKVIEEKLEILNAGLSLRPTLAIAQQLFDIGLDIINAHSDFHSAQRVAAKLALSPAIDVRRREQLIDYIDTQISLSAQYYAASWRKILGLLVPLPVLQALLDHSTPLEPHVVRTLPASMLMDRFKHCTYPSELKAAADLVLAKSGSNDYHTLGFVLVEDPALDMESRVRLAAEYPLMDSRPTWATDELLATEQGQQMLYNCLLHPSGSFFSARWQCETIQADTFSKGMKKYAQIQHGPTYSWRQSTALPKLLDSRPDLLPYMPATLVISISNPAKDARLSTRVLDYLYERLGTDSDAWELLCSLTSSFSGTLDELIRATYTIHTPAISLRVVQRHSSVKSAPGIS